jgi:hypothetical protein
MHQPMEVRHRDDMPWETIRWPGETGKMLFHPRPERPTEPNAGILRLEPGAQHPLHHIGGRDYGAGTMIFHPDPHYEDEFSTETGGEILIVQERRPLAAERIDR